MEHQCDNNCQKIMLECCEAFQRYGVRQTLQEMDFERGLWTAAKDGDLERVQELLDKGASPNEQDASGYRPLHYAARNGHYRVCELLLDKGAEVNAITRSIRATALHRAAMQGHSEVVNTLLHYGADVNIKDVDGSTALHRALSVVAPCGDVFKLLIPKTDLEIRDGAGRTVEDLAAMNDCESALALLIQLKEKMQRRKEMQEELEKEVEQETKQQQKQHRKQQQVQ